jgi:hypothetical protein
MGVRPFSRLLPISATFAPLRFLPIGPERASGEGCGECSVGNVLVDDRCYVRGDVEAQRDDLRRRETYVFSIAVDGRCDRSSGAIGLEDSSGYKAKPTL